MTRNIPHQKGQVYDMFIQTNTNSNEISSQNSTLNVSIRITFDPINILPIH